jgi:hypothetical protein
MTPDAPDMSTPVTRGELREDLAQLDQKFKQWLEIWGGALLTRIESTEQRLNERIGLVEQHLHADLARHTSAVYESMTAQIRVIDEKYADLPARVHQLEGNVFLLERH